MFYILNNEYSSFPSQLRTKFILIYYIKSQWKFVAVMWKNVKKWRGINNFGKHCTESEQANIKSCLEGSDLYFLNVQVKKQKQKMANFPFLALSFVYLDPQQSLGQSVITMNS